MAVACWMARKLLASFAQLAPQFRSTCLPIHATSCRLTSGPQSLGSPWAQCQLSKEGSPSLNWGFVANNIRPGSPGLRPASPRSHGNLLLSGELSVQPLAKDLMLAEALSLEPRARVQLQTNLWSQSNLRDPRLRSPQTPPSPSIAHTERTPCQTSLKESLERATPEQNDARLHLATCGQQ